MAHLKNIPITQRINTAAQTMAQNKFNALYESIAYSFESPNRKSAEQPHVSQMITTHSGFTASRRPLHKFVILTCCAASLEFGHNNAAKSFFNTVLPCSFARAIACSILIIFWMLKLIATIPCAPIRFFIAKCVVVVAPFLVVNPNYVKPIFVRINNQFDVAVLFRKFLFCFFRLKIIV